MKKLINFIKGKFAKKESIMCQRHFSAVSKKDESGRYRYFIYIDGKLCKEEVTIYTWLKNKNEL